MRYIHSQESLTIPENGEYNLCICENPKPEQSVALNPQFASCYTHVLGLYWDSY